MSQFYHAKALQFKNSKYNRYKSVNKEESKIIQTLSMQTLVNKSTSLYLLSQQQILGTGNLPQDSAPVCINIDISPEMAAQSAQRNQAFCVTASDWSPITSA